MVPSDCLREETIRVIRNRLDELYSGNGVIPVDQVKLTSLIYDIPKEVRVALAPEIQQLHHDVQFHETHTKEYATAQLEGALGTIFESYASLQQLQQERNQPPPGLPGCPTPIEGYLLYDANGDDITSLPNDHRTYFEELSIEVLRSELRSVYSEMYGTSTSAVAPSVNLNSMELYTSLSIVHSQMRNGHHIDPADTFSGELMESTTALNVIDKKEPRFLLVEGRAGIGKSTWATYLAQLQKYNHGIVVVVLLSELAAYLKGKTEGRLSPRELMFVSFGKKREHAALIDRLFYHVRLNTKKPLRIAWIFDGLDEMPSLHQINDPNLANVIAALAAFGGVAQRKPFQFDNSDLLVVTSREERNGEFPSASNVATINPWSDKEAILYIKKYFSQPTNNISQLDTDNCVRAAINAVKGNRFGSFSTIPIVLEMICWTAASPSRSTNTSVTKLFEETVKLMLRIARERFGVEKYSTDEEIISLCKELSRKTTDGVFFDIDPKEKKGTDLIYSRLVRERNGPALISRTARFVHKSFLEYFQALYFAEHLDELGSETRDYPISTRQHEDVIEWIQFTSSDDMVRIVVPDRIDPTVIQLHIKCCRPVEQFGNTDFDVVWIAGKSDKDEFVRGSSLPSNDVNCRMRHNDGITKNVTVQPGGEYFLIIRPTSGSVIAPVKCCWKGAVNPIITQKLPLCDIPSDRQQRNFFLLLADAVNATNVQAKKKQLLDYLISRLRYHHPRIASWMCHSERSLAFHKMPFPNGTYTSNGQSKAQFLSEMGLSIVTECAAVLMDDGSNFGTLIGSVVEGTSTGGRLLEALNIKTKSIYEWAILPAAQYGTSVMWRSIESCISKDTMKALAANGTALQEALIASFVRNQRVDAAYITSSLMNLGVTINLPLACRTGASVVIMKAIDNTIARDVAYAIDDILYFTLVKSLRAAQYDTAEEVWKKITTVKHPTPRVWSLLFTPLTTKAIGERLSPNAAEMREWLEKRCHVLAMHIPQTLFPQLEQHAIHTFPAQCLHHGIRFGIVTLLGLLKTTLAPLIMSENVNALRKIHQEQQLTVQVLKARIRVSSNALLDTIRSHTLSLSELRKISIEGGKRDTLKFGQVLQHFRDSPLQELEFIDCNITISDDILRRWMVNNISCQRCTVDQSILAAHVLQLKFFSVASCSCNFDVVSAVSQQNTLEDLRISHPDPLSPISLQNINLLTRLEHLELTGCNFVTDSEVAHVAALTQLCYLDLTACAKITDHGVSKIVVLSRLHTLKLSECVNVTNAAVDHIVLMKTLRSLSVNRCLNITDKGAICIATNLVELEQLDIGGCSLTDVGVGSIADLTKLQRLDLHVFDLDGKGKGNKITDSAIKKVISSLKELKHLDLNWCSMVTNDGIERISSRNSLIQLCLRGCGNITNTGLSRIETLSQLRFLDLSNCTVTDKCATSIGLLVHLEHLQLRGCKKITDVGVSRLVALTQLLHLDLGLCSGVTDVGMTSIGLLTRLQYLDLNSCGRVTGKGLEGILSLTQLRHLDIEHCSQITRSTITQLKLSLVELRHFKCSTK